MNVLAPLAVLAAQEPAKFEADRPWLPESAEIIWGTIAFLIIAYVIWRFGRKPISAAMRARTDRIAKEISTAATSRASAETELSSIRTSLSDLDAERARISADANATAERMRAEGMARNDAEVTDLEARAAADIEALRTRAASELQHTVGQWSAEAAERIVASVLDDAARARLAEDFIATVGAGHG
jgi:F-type H+-transporting ATPase subunit b